MLEKFKQELKNKGEIYLNIKAHPNSRETTIREILNNQTMKVDIKAPPIKGKANQELINFLAMEFKVNKNNVKIISGIKDRNKLVKIIK